MPYKFVHINLNNIHAAFNSHDENMAVHENY